MRIFLFLSTLVTMALHVSNSSIVLRGATITAFTPTREHEPWEPPAAPPVGRSCLVFDDDKNRKVRRERQLYIAWPRGLAWTSAW